MAHSDFMNKVRQLDNKMAKWMMRHFYFLFFQIVLVFVFVFWFINLFGVIDSSIIAEKTTTIEHILSAQSINTTIIVLLMLLNSFWILYIFNSIMRMHATLKDMSYHIARLRKNN